MAIRVSVAALMAGLLNCSNPASSARLSDFAGTWENIHPSTRTATALRIETRDASHINISAWASCNPVSCPWGSAEGTPYAANIHSSVAAETRVITALFVSPVAEKRLIVHAPEGGRLLVEILTRFTDGSARSNVSEIATFRHARSDAADTAPRAANR